MQVTFPFLRCQVEVKVEIETQSAIVCLSNFPMGVEIAHHGSQQ